MRYILNLISGSFFRTIGRIFAYIVIGVLVVYFASFLNITSVNAEVIANGESFGVDLGGVTSFPTNYSVGGNSESSKLLTLYNYEGISRPYTYLIASVCSTGSLSSWYIYNPSYNYYFDEASFTYYYTGKSCTTSGYNGTIYYFQLQVGQYEDADGTGEEVAASSYLRMKNTYSWNVQYTIKNWFLSSDDFLSQLSSDGKLLDQMIAVENGLADVDDTLSSINSTLGTTNDKLDDLKDTQEETNEKLDDVNNSITSDSSDTTSKSCGIICKLKGIFTGIIELPSKIINLLIDALKSLFVPTDEQLYEIINNSKDLSENFGFVGESVNFFLEIFTSLLGMVNHNGCLELPELTIGSTSLFDSFTFWKAQQVCLADNKILSDNIETIRTITSVVLVGLFIGFASLQFFGILSKNSSGESYTVDSDGSVTETRWSFVNGSKTSVRSRW